MTSEPTLSVLMPNYNHAAYLPRAIEEIVGQSRLPDEFIVLDDASTDRSVAIIESYVARYPFMRLIRHEQNQGVIEAHRRLFKEAQGDYIYAGAADDGRCEGCFERVMDMAKKYPTAGIIFGRMQVVDQEDRQLGVLGVRRWQEPLFASPARFLQEYLDVEAPSHSLCGATVYRRTCFEEVGWYRNDLGPWCDTFAARAIGLKYGACYLPECLTVWRKLEGSYSDRSRSDARYTLELIERIAQLMGSEEFRDRFPSEHVRRWRRRYRQLTLWNAWLGDDAGRPSLRPTFLMRVLRNLPKLPGVAALALRNRS